MNNILYIDTVIQFSCANGQLTTRFQLIFFKKNSCLRCSLKSLHRHIHRSFVCYRSLRGRPTWTKSVSVSYRSKESACNEHCQSKKDLFGGRFPEPSLMSDSTVYTDATLHNGLFVKHAFLQSSPHSGVIFSPRGQGDGAGY